MAGLVARVHSFFLSGGATVGSEAPIFHFFAPCTELKAEFRFEWHRKSQRLYVVDIAQGVRNKRVVANVMAFNIQNEGMAYNHALCWCRGYLACRESRSHNDQGKLVLLGAHS